MILLLNDPFTYRNNDCENNCEIKDLSLYINIFYFS